MTFRDARRKRDRGGLRKMGWKRLIPAIALILSSPATARANVPAERLYVPTGYDETDEVVVVVEGYLDSTCYQIRKAKVVLNGSVFDVYPQAEKQGVDCDPLPVPYVLEVLLNPDDAIAPGRYQVRVASKTKNLVETLQVEEAEVNQVDNHPYAPVDDAEVGMLSGGRMRATIEGRFQNTCMVIDRIDVSTQNGKTYEMLPIVKMLKKDPKGDPCRQKERRFDAFRDFAEPPPGRYLLHVRSQNGHSVNHIFTNVW